MLISIYFSRISVHQFGDWSDPDSAGIKRMPDPLLLLHLPPRHHQLSRIFYHHVVATIGHRMVNRFVFALEEGGDSGGETADGGATSIQKMPSPAISQSSLLGGKKRETQRFIFAFDAYPFYFGVIS